MVLSRRGGRYRVWSDGEICEASLRGRLKRGDKKRILVGDEVLVRLHADGEATIEEILPRRSELRRRTPGKRRGVRAVAANVQQVVAIGAAKEPPWDPQLMDRFIAVAEANHLPIVVVVNKCDLLADAEPLAAPYRKAGYVVVLTSVPDGRGLTTLRAQLEDHISLLTGSTGVGKSSLLNALQPGLRLRTAPVSRKSGVGRHTTVAAEMHHFGENGFVVDTPGLRDIGLWGLEPLEVVAAFPEIANYAVHCRFDNCRHLEEPDCAVAAAVAHGKVAESRLESYRRLYEESMEAARAW